MSVIHPPIHTLIYGDSGSGKSTGAATFPAPMLVLMWDPVGKETPYRRRGSAQPPTYRDDGTPITDILDKKGNLLIRIEQYHDINPKEPTAYPRFLNRLPRLHEDMASFETLVCDSVTFMEICARKYNQYVLSPRAKEPRQWFAASTDTLEEILLIAFGAMTCNIVVCAHIDEDKDEVNGALIRNPAAPGRLRKRSPAGFSEVYHAYVKRSEAGTLEYLWQTRTDHLYNAQSQIQAPDPSPQHYMALWTGISVP